MLKVPSTKIQLCPRVISVCLHLFCNLPLPTRFYCPNLLSSFPVIKTACTVLICMRMLAEHSYHAKTLMHAEFCYRKVSCINPSKWQVVRVGGWMRNRSGCEQELSLAGLWPKPNIPICCTEQEERSVSHMLHPTKIRLSPILRWKCCNHTSK